MRVLIIGGTGFNGRRIVARLLDAEHQVSVVSRRTLPADWHSRVAHLQVDRADAAAFRDACAGREFDAVIDNIAYRPRDAEIALETLGDRIQQYLFTSTMAVYHDLLTRAAPAHESDADLDYTPGPDEGLETALHHVRGHSYAIDKRAVERVAARSGTAWTALRASVIVGPDDWVGVIWWWIQRILDGGPILVPDTGPGHAFQVTDVGDLAKAFVAALGNPAALNRAYNIAGPEHMTAETWAEALGGPLGRTVECVRVPPSIVTAAGLTDYRLAVAGLPFGQVLLDTCRAQQELGFVATPPAVWGRETALGCAAAPPTKDSNHYTEQARETALARAYSEARAAGDRAFVESLARPD
ncbi:MAG: SDR family oxidoreductase [Chloroflexota bacterium]